MECFTKQKKKKIKYIIFLFSCELLLVDGFYYRYFFAFKIAENLFFLLSSFPPLGGSGEKGTNNPMRRKEEREKKRREGRRGEN